MKIYILTHTKCEAPEDDLYQCLDVTDQYPEYQSAAAGENIMNKGKIYGELTGLYWIWKNVTADSVGVCQYRRYFVDDQQQILTGEGVMSLLAQADVILPEQKELTKSYEEYYQEHHNMRDLLQVRNCIHDSTPEYNEAFGQLMKQQHFYPVNLMLMKKDMYDRYASWMFGLLAELEMQVDLRYYRSRAFAPLAEALFNTFAIKEKIIPLTCPVKVTHEKAELLEMKHKVIALLCAGQVREANQCYYEYQSQDMEIRAAVEANRDHMGFLVQLLMICQEDPATAQKVAGQLAADPEEGMAEILDLYQELRQILIDPSGAESQRFLVEHEISWVTVREALKGMNMKPSYRGKIAERVSETYKIIGRAQDAEQLSEVRFQ